MTVISERKEKEIQRHDTKGNFLNTLSQCCNRKYLMLHIKFDRSYVVGGMRVVM